MRRRRFEGVQNKPIRPALRRVSRPQRPFMQEISPSRSQKKVWDLIKDMRVAMFVTRNASGAMSARPMSAVNREFADTLWFMTRSDSPRLDEVHASSQVLIAYAEPKDKNYVSVRGNARVVMDKAKVRDLWSEAARVWFPKGPDEDDIALIEVTIETAEYWDAPNAAMVYACGYAGARPTGEPPHVGENSTVRF
jgi:general stress protein 26